MQLEAGLRDFLRDLPFQTGPVSHVVAALNDEKFKATDELLRSCAELARVEQVMGWLHHSWQIPTLGGQEPQWELRTNLLKKIADVSKAAWKADQKQQEEWAKEDEE